MCTRMNTMSERSPALYEIEHNKHETKILFQKRFKSILTEMSYYDYTLYTEILFKIVWVKRSFPNNILIEIVGKSN